MAIRTVARHVAAGIGLLVLCYPVTLVAEFLLFPLWSFIEDRFGIESVGHDFPAAWCFWVTFAACASLFGLLYVASLRRPPRGRRMTASRVALLALVLVACALLALGGVAYWETAGQRAELSRPSKIVITEIRHDLLLSKRGNPLGVRLVYPATFPGGELSTILPPGITAVLAERSSAPGESDISTAVVSWSVTPEVPGPQPTRYRSGTTYTFTEERVPRFLESLNGLARRGGAGIGDRDDSGLCVDFGAYERELAGDVDASLRLVVYPPNAPGREITTIGREYSLRTFYEGAIREGLAPCPHDLVPGLPYFGRAR